MEHKKENLERWHGAHNYSNKIHWLFVLFLFFSVILLFWSYFELNDLTTKVSKRNIKIAPTAGVTKNPSDQVFCTQEAKLCPDGSYVGRTGPNCEFAPCP